MVYLLIGWQLFAEIYNSYSGLELLMPLLCKRDVITLKTDDFFDEEKLEIMYLTPAQTKRLENKMKQNPNWNKGKIDKKILKALRFHTRDDIFNQIPSIKNKYWIFTGCGQDLKNRHNTKKILDGVYYAITFGVLDKDNNIFYYYEYDD